MGYHTLLQGIFPDPGIEPASLTSPTLTGRFFTASATWLENYKTQIVFVVLFIDLSFFFFLFHYPRIVS